LALERASLVKSRVETEKSYFLRKIDEKTFRSIITEKQSKIYKLKSTIELKKELQSTLVRRRLNPLHLKKWIKEKMDKRKYKREKKQK